MKSEAAKLREVRDGFVAQWGVMGSHWGINRTMAQVHALLMTSPDAMSTDEVMEELSISRGNAHTNLKELVNWGLLRIVIRKGERKEYFEAELDVVELVHNFGFPHPRSCGIDVTISSGPRSPDFYNRAS